MANDIRLGSIVHLDTTGDAPSVYVVCGEDAGRLRLSYCGSSRWYVAKWYPHDAVTLATDEKNKHVRRARRLLARVKPDPDGWRRIRTGKPWNAAMECVGHTALEAP